MQILLPIAHRIAARLTPGKATLSVAESSAGGLISAALLAVPGASAYYLGGGVVYTRASRQVLLGMSMEALRSAPPGTEAAALVLARACQARFGSTWAIAETGATGPSGSRYGYGAGHAAIAVVGPQERAIILETGSPDRVGNMRVFAAAALDLLEQTLRG